MLNLSALRQLFLDTRSGTERICSFLKIEDHVVQPIVDVSPPKWHLGHSTWFFEELILKKLSGYKEYDSRFSFLFNSYYETLGEKVMRTNRGNLTRPTVEEVLRYRQYVTQQMMSFLEGEKEFPKKLLEVLELGIHHEKQHQELLYTDIKYILGTNPLFPPYNKEFQENPVQEFQQEWVQVEEGVYAIGHGNPSEFCYDNELGRHKVYLQEFRISNKLVTNAEFLEFIEEGCYSQPLLWHAEGWDWVQQQQIAAPLYWHVMDGKYNQYTLQGLEILDPAAPLCHISFFEASAFAEWKGMRLPTEFEWEVAQERFPWGSRWEWTESAYLPYPNFTKDTGPLGEYNGKFMVNQKVLRGSSVASAPQHIRPTYRNFFHPELRWQFTGMRLVKNDS